MATLFPERSMRLAHGVIGVAGYVLAGLAACSFVLGLWLASTSLVIASGVERTTGTVVGHREANASGGGRVYTPQVEFVSDNGVRYTFSGQITAPIPRFAERSTVPVRYLREDPRIARIDLFVDNSLAPLVALMLGALSAIAAFVLVRSARRELGA